MVKYKIAISGKAKSGKDTISQLIGHYNDFIYKSKYYSFAKQIKQIAQIMFPLINYSALFGSSQLRETIIEDAFNIDNKPLTVRQLLCDIGKNGRKYNPNIWINALMSEIKNTNHQDTTCLIISDLRFKNEYESLKKDNWILIRVKRPNNDYILNDISETELDDLPDSAFDYVFINDQPLDKLSTQIEKLVDAIIAR